MLPPTHMALEALFAVADRPTLTRSKPASRDIKNLYSCSSALSWAYKLAGRQLWNILGSELHFKPTERFQSFYIVTCMQNLFSEQILFKGNWGLMHLLTEYFHNQTSHMYRTQIKCWFLSLSVKVNINSNLGNIQRKITLHAFVQSTPKQKAPICKIPYL